MIFFFFFFFFAMPQKQGLKMILSSLNGMAKPTQTFGKSLLKALNMGIFVSFMTSSQISRYKKK